MSNILRSTLKYSVKQFGNCLKFTDGVFVHRPAACINQIFNNNFQTSVPYSRPPSIDQQIKKLDLDARRNGRISLREVEDVIAEIRTSRSASGSQSLMVIRCCGNLISEEIPEKRTQLVQEVWNTLEKLGISLDISHYNALLRVYLENNHPFVPTELLAELEQKGIEPNRVTYQRFITRYCQTGDIEGATRILQFMREKEMPINEVVFNALVLGHSKANDMESAEGILNVMKQAGIDPTAETYTILICGYINEGNLDKVNSILEECEDKGIVFIDKDYLEMIYHMALKDIDIDPMLSKMKRNTGYNQDAVNYVYRLTNAGKLEVAFKIVKSMVRSSRLDGTLTPTGGFFISALVRNDVPVADIFKYCDKLVEENLNLQSLSIAMENSLRFKKESLALELFRGAKERSIPLRPHFFWPLIVARGKQNDLNGLYKLIATMNMEFGLPIYSDTVREYIVPFALKENANLFGVLNDLKSCGVSTATSVSAIVIHLLSSGRIRDAAEIAANYRANYPMTLIRKPLLNSYLKTADADSFTTILKNIALGIEWRANAAQQEAAEKDDEELAVPEYRESIGQIVLEVVKEIKNKDTCKTDFEEILKLMHQKGVGISNRAAEAIQTQLQDKLTQGISSLLESLTGDDLPVVESTTTGARRGSGVRKPQNNLDEDSLLRLYEQMKSKGEVSKSILKQIFSLYGRQHNVEKLLELKEEMDKVDFVLSNGMYAYIIDAYVEHEKLDEAWQILKSRIEQEPDFVLNPTKMLRIALLAVQKEDYDKAVEILKKKASLNENAQTAENTPFMTGSLCWRIVNHFAEKGDVENVKQYFDLIVDNEYCTVNNILLGPLIKVHLQRDDLEGALKEFENCCVKYRATPFKTELTKRCIETEDAVNLQRLTDLSTEIHGEINSLYDLMISFLECGRLRQAKKILETPGLRLRSDRLQNACQKYQNSGSIENLENLLAVTKDAQLDRSDLYYNLLLAYDKAGDPQKAMSVWLQIQENNETPTDPFLILLADILKKHDLAVPFNVPQFKEIPLRVQRAESRVEMSKFSKTLRKFLNDGEIDEAVKYKDSLKPEQLNNTDLSLLLEKLLQDGRYNEAKNIYQDLSARGSLPITHVLKFLLIKASFNGDIEFMESIESSLGEPLKAQVDWRNRSGQAYIRAGRGAEFLDKLEKELDSINSNADLESYMRKLPKSVLLTLLHESAEFLPQVRRLADKCLERDSRNIAPINTIWLYHLSKKNYDEAEKLWCDYLQNYDQPINFKAFSSRVAKEGDVESLNVLKSFIERKPTTTPRSLGIIYGSLIEVYVAQDKVPDAVKTLEEAVSKIGIDNIRIKALETLKAACISRNIPFNHEIPERKPRRVEESDSD